MFEFDTAKSVANKDKHGIDFVEAQSLWLDEDAYSIPSSQTHHGEERGLLVARFDRRTWVAIFTIRNGLIRLISVRRARDHEEAAYDQARKH